MTPRNLLYKEFVRVVRVLRPKAFVMENVPNMLAMQNGHFRTKILNAFRRAGYARVCVSMALAFDFGVPQHRLRAFVFGIRDGLPFKGDLAKTTQALIDEQKAERPVTVREALSGLPKAVSADDGPFLIRKSAGDGIRSIRR